MISSQVARRAVWRPLWQLPARFDLVLSLAKRELAARYKGSVLGILWALLTPIVMIAIFTIIFAGIFKAKFGVSNSSWDYALYLFCGLLPWNAFQESVQLSATTIVGHANLVKRVVFPLEALPVSQSLAAIANQMFGTLALLAAVLILRRELHPTILLLPVLLIPQFIATLGAARVMHLDRDLGSVEAGKLADVILVDGKPSESISDIRRVSLVVKDGAVFDPAAMYREVGVQPSAP